MTILSVLLLQYKTFISLYTGICNEHLHCTKQAKANILCEIDFCVMTKAEMLTYISAYSRMFRISISNRILELHALTKLNISQV